MKTVLSLVLTAAILLCCLASCKDNEPTGDGSGGTDTVTALPPVHIPPFNRDTAYNYIAEQVAFGPRVPGSAAQKACADWMQQKLTAVCDTVYRQSTTVTGGDSKRLPCINLIGVIHPAAKRRVLLLAHWDSRPWADEDVKDIDKPIDAADDGGSGVAVLLELARALKSQPLPQNMGIDILFTDVEDYGKTEWGEDSYCLGTQYWAQHPHVAGYSADYGILLDMVGARNARFPMERSSAQFAQDVQQRVWQAAGRAGYSSYFPYTPSPAGVTDDHVYINKLAKIPTVDIIHLTDATQSNFPPHWHTHKDNMQVIDKATLQAVGRTLLQVLFETGA